MKIIKLLSVWFFISSWSVASQAATSIKIAELNWAGSTASAYVMKAVLEEYLDADVEIVGGDEIALFEATHGTAPKYAGQDKVNPGSVILSGVMMFEHIGWREVSNLIVKALEKTVLDKDVTYDLHRQIEGANLLKCSEFGDAIIKNMDNV